MRFSGRMARRLLLPVSVLFLVLLVLSSLGQQDQATRSDIATAPSQPPSSRTVATVEATMPAAREVRAKVGDLVTLTVESDEPGSVEIPAFGETEPAGPEAPAIFDVLPTEPGSYPVRSTVTGEELGVLVVEPAEETETG
jgi:hypothetical protein